MLVSAANQTAQAVAKAAAASLKEKFVGDSQAGASVDSVGSEWVKGLLGKKEWRVPCLDVLIRM